MAEITEAEPEGWKWAAARDGNVMPDDAVMSEEFDPDEIAGFFSRER